MDLSGQTFGSWLVLRKSDRIGRSRQIYWVCKCECGAVKDVLQLTLRNGSSKSCGCTAKDWCRIHGMEKTRTYWVWAGMIQRCENPKFKWYHRYGGRGIKVCPKWRNSFVAFFEDMGEKPEGKSLERLNNDGDYEKENCIWATRKQQIRNRGVTPFVEFEGSKISVSELAEKFGLSHRRVADRIKRGYTPEQAVLPSLRKLGWNKRR